MCIRDSDVVVVATVLCVDQDNSPEVAAMIGASAALSISDIPFGGPTEMCIRDRYNSKS